MGRDSSAMSSRLRSKQPQILRLPLSQKTRQTPLRMTASVGGCWRLFAQDDSGSVGLGKTRELSRKDITPCKRASIEGCYPGTSFQIPAAIPTRIQPKQTT